MKQLFLANESAGGGVVVVMAEREKEDMEIDIQKMELDMRGTAVICRSGSALVPADLKKVNVTTARWAALPLPGGLLCPTKVGYGAPTRWATLLLAVGLLCPHQP